VTAAACSLDLTPRFARYRAMDIYLPIAGISESVFVLLALGGAVGFLSGIFGVGGGWLMTPLLIFIGVPPAVAVATSANQLVGTSVAGAVAHWRRGNVDFAMGLVLLAGGLAGSALGVWLFSLLRRIGQIELAINIFYVVMLGAVGGFMLVESARAVLFPPPVLRRKLHQHTWLHGLPLKMRFRRSKLYISALISAPWCRRRWVSPAACCRRCWAWAAASSWCRP
jgi:uncharacterized protein